MNEEYNVDGIMNFIGSSIGVAVDDYKSLNGKVYEANKNLKKLSIKVSKIRDKKSKKYASEKARVTRLQEIIRNYETAKAYLFNKEYLEDFIEKHSLPLDIDYIRTKVNIKENKNDNEISKYKRGSRHVSIRSAGRTYEI